MMRKVLCLSTAHIPTQDAGERLKSDGYGVLLYEYGFAMFVPGGGCFISDHPGHPEWLIPIMVAAKDCTLILFDGDEDVDERFKTYEWIPNFWRDNE